MFTNFIWSLMVEIDSIKGWSWSMWISSLQEASSVFIPGSFNQPGRARRRRRRWRSWRWSWQEVWSPEEDGVVVQDDRPGDVVLGVNPPNVGHQMAKGLVGMPKSSIIQYSLMIWEDEDFYCLLCCISNPWTLFSNKWKRFTLIVKWNLDVA